MKAAVFRKYGPPEVLKIEDVPKPVPKDNQVLIKVKACSVSAGDCELRRFDFPGWFWLPLRLVMGLFKPRIKILGQELSGEIVALGSKVDNFQLGDEICTITNINMGGYGEYVALKSTWGMALKPSNMSFTQAAGLPVGAFNALHFVRKANLQHGQKMLINGAGGSIGTIALQMAKHKGVKVTCVDSADKLDMLTSLGADHVLDYQKGHFSENNDEYDVIFDMVQKNSLPKSLRVLKEGGCYILANMGTKQVRQGIWASWTKKQKIVMALAGENPEDLKHVVQLVEQGVIKTMIDKEYKLENIVEAHRYVESGKKQGCVVIDFSL